MERTFSATKIRYRKLSTSGALSARSSRQAGLLARSQAISSNSRPAAMRLIVGARYDIRLRIRGWRRLVPHSQCATGPPGRARDHDVGFAVLGEADQG